MKLLELFEASVGADLAPTKIPHNSVTDALKYLNEHCSDAMWMLENSSPLFRGDGARFAGGKFGKLDPSATVRKSENTANHYTEIFDNLPSMKDYPKRSRSLIVSNEEYTARAFGYPYVIIPFNNVPIGVVNSADIWFAPTGFDSLKIKSVPKLLNALPEQWEPMIKELKRLGNVLDRLRADRHRAQDEKDKQILLQMMDYLRGITTYDLLDPIEWFEKNLSPKQTGFTLHTTKNLSAKMDKESEMWVGGPVVIIDIDFWNDLCEEM